MELAIINNQNKVSLIQDVEKILISLGKITLTKHNLPEDMEVTLMLVDDGEIKQLNSQYRGKDNKTDVLSFPQYESLAELTGELGNRDSVPGLTPVLLGDIVISLETANAQGEEYGHGLTRELGFLFVHGLLHLLGYDHMDEVGQGKMRRMEEVILAEVSLGR